MRAKASPRPATLACSTPPTSNSAAPGGRVGQLEHPRQPRDDRPDRGAGLADGLPAPAVCARTEPGRTGLVTPETVTGQPGQTQPRPAHRAGQDPAQAD